jgi:hypothetical protein
MSCAPWKSFGKGVVLDTFAGSGTTILAAERTGRRARALEIDPGYVDVALRRWTDLTGELPVQADKGGAWRVSVNRRASCGWTPTAAAMGSSTWRSFPASSAWAAL